MSSEQQTTKYSPKFSEVVDALSDLVHTDETEEDDIAYPSWNTRRFRSFEISPAIAEQCGLGNKVRLSAVGDASMGVALIFRSRNLFNTSRYDYFVQREQEDGLSVWHGPATKPKNDSWIGAAMIDQATVAQASPEITQSLIGDLLNAAQQE